MARQGTAVAHSPDLVLVDPEDDLASVRGKLEQVSGETVFLTIPVGVPALRSPLEFRILARLAHELATDVIVVTADGERRRLARQEGFRTRSSVRSVRELIGPRRPAYLSVFEWLPIPRPGTVLLTLFVMAAALALGVLVLPVMRIRVVAAAQPVQEVVEVQVDPNVRAVDPARRVLPGEVLQQRLEVVDSVPTTGIKTVGRERAKGQVTFVNRNSSEVIVPQGTIVVARSGAKFATDEHLRVPALSAVGARVGITAVDAGSSGNVGAGEINRMERPIAGLTVRNNEPTDGGTDAEVKVVAEEDLARLKEMLVKKARDQAAIELAARAGPDRSLPVHSVRVRTESESYDRTVGTEGEQLTGRMVLTASGVAFVNQELNSVVEKSVLGRAGEGYKTVAGLLKLSPPEVVAVEDQKLKLRVAASGTVTSSLDAARIADMVRGSTVGEARSVLAEIPGQARPPQVEMWPAWADRAWRVEVDIQQGP